MPKASLSVIALGALARGIWWLWEACALHNIPQFFAPLFSKKVDT